MKNYIIAFVGFIVGVSIAGAILSNNSKSTSIVPPLGALDFNLIRTTTSASSTVTNSSSIILATSTARLYAAFVNDGSNAVYLSLTAAPAVAGKGIRLNPNGGSFELTPENMYVGPVTAITSSGTSNVTVTSSQ